MRARRFSGLGEGTSLVSAFTSGARQLASDQVRGVVFRSQLSPDVSLTAPQAMGGQPRRAGLSELFWQVAKPAVYVDTSVGLVRLAPWGEPRMNLFPWLVIGTAVGGAVLLGVVVRGLRS